MAQSKHLKGRFQAIPLSVFAFHHWGLLNLHFKWQRKWKFPFLGSHFRIWNFCYTVGKRWNLFLICISSMFAIGLNLFRKQMKVASLPWRSFLKQPERPSARTKPSEQKRYLQRSHPIPSCPLIAFDHLSLYIQKHLSIQSIQWWFVAVCGTTRPQVDNYSRLRYLRC